MLMQLGLGLLNVNPPQRVEGRGSPNPRDRGTRVAVGRAAATGSSPTTTWLRVTLVQGQQFLYFITCTFNFKNLILYFCDNEKICLGIFFFLTEKES